MRPSLHLRHRVRTFDFGRSGGQKWTRFFSRSRALVHFSPLPAQRSNSQFCRPAKKTFKTLVFIVVLDTFLVHRVGEYLSSPCLRTLCSFFESYAQKVGWSAQGTNPVLKMQGWSAKGTNPVPKTTGFRAKGSSLGPRVQTLSSPPCPLSTGFEALVSPACIWSTGVVRWAL